MPDCDQSTTKTCTKCNAAKPLPAFSPSKTARDGLASWCRDCVNQQTRDKRRQNPEKSRASARAWAQANPERCREKDRKRALRHPGRTSAQAREWRKRHPEKFAVYKARWKAANRDSINARNRENYAKDPVRYLNKCHKRRAHLSEAGVVTPADVDRIREAQRNRCAICRIGLKGRGQQDHILPLKKGGAHKPSNIQLLCAPCNQRKGPRDPIAHMQSLGRLI